MGDDNISVPGLFVVNLTFISITVMYLCVKIAFATDQNNLMVAGSYLLVVLFTQYLYNMWIILGTHKTSNTTMALSSMIFWVVFIIIYFIINMGFPVWKVPFSNTIGYAIANIISPIESQFINMLAHNNSDAEPSRGVIEAINQVRKQPLIFLTKNNSLNYKGFLNELKADGAFSKMPDPEWEHFTENIGKWYLYKDIISEGVWLALTGALTIAVSYYFIVSAPISASPESIELLEAKRKAAEAEKNKTESKPKFVTHAVGSYAPFNK